MRIKSVHVKNYGPIRDATLNCDPMTILVGKNGTGKSSFLRALDLFCDPAREVVDDDFHYSSQTTPISVEVEFTDLNDEEKQEFRRYMQGESLMVMREFLEPGKGRYHSFRMQHPELAEIRQIARKPDKRKAFIELIKSDGLPGYDASQDYPSNNEQVEAQMETYESGNPNLLEAIREGNQFLGATNVGIGTLLRATKLVFIPAVKEAVDEIHARGSGIQQLIDTLVVDSIARNDEHQKFVTEYRERLESLYRTENLPIVGEIAEKLTTGLREFAPDADVEIASNTHDLADPPMPKIETHIREDGFPSDIAHKGHGLQRMLIVSLLKFMAENSRTVDAEDGEQSGVDLILVIEEPELYLHPSACRRFNQVLEDLSQSTGVQILCCTHSPYFVGIERADNIRLIRKDGQGDNRPETTCRQQSLDDITEINAKASKLRNASTEGFVARSLSVMNDIVNAGFFAGVVVLVEGVSDAAALWAVQEHGELDWSSKDIVIIPVGGKENLDRPFGVFNGFGIPTYMIFDADGDLTDDNNKRIFRLLGVDAPVHEGSCCITERFTCFTNDLEDALEKDLGDKYCTITSEVKDKLNFHGRERKKALKKPAVMTCVVDAVYDKELCLPTLERIVVKISEMSAHSVSVDT
jgi:putative ATP-dependent endonuclease of the OLD family